jgi:L,D-transpeptidase-like protein/putative peptidoglycan binding protein
MRRRLLVAAGLLSAVGGIALSAGGAYVHFWDQGRTDLIAEGVRVAGVDVGGLRAPEARELLQGELGQRLSRPVRLVYGHHGFTVRPGRAGLRIDTARMVDAAIDLSRQGDLADRVLRDVRGRRVHGSIPLAAALSTTHVETLADRVARVLDRPARNARIVPMPAATALRIFPSRLGLAVKRPLLQQRLMTASLRLDDRRAVAIPTKPVRPQWSTASLKSRYGTFVMVSRETFSLRLFKRLKLAKTYRIAVGRAGLETPAGFYTIDDKQVNPSWHVPLSSWAGSLAGRIIPPGPDDPIKSRWLGFYNGAGIHGTDAIWSLGTAASHGCIRMAIPDVEQLYELVPLHTPIYVG